MGRKYGWGWAFKQVMFPKPKRRKRWNSTDDFLRKVHKTSRDHDKKFYDVKREVRRRGWI